MIVSQHDGDHGGVVRVFVGAIPPSSQTSVINLMRGNRTPGSRVASGCKSLVAQARYCSSFQLTHMSRGDHALVNQVSNGVQREDKNLFQC